MASGVLWSGGIDAVIKVAEWEPVDEQYTLADSLPAELRTMAHVRAEDFQ